MAIATAVCPRMFFFPLTYVNKKNVKERNEGEYRIIPYTVSYRKKRRVKKTIYSRYSLYIPYMCILLVSWWNLNPSERLWYMIANERLYDTHGMHIWSSICVYMYHTYEGSYEASYRIITGIYHESDAAVRTISSRNTAVHSERLRGKGRKLLVLLN